MLKRWSNFKYTKLPSSEKLREKIKSINSINYPRIISLFHSIIISSTPTATLLFEIPSSIALRYLQIPLRISPHIVPQYFIYTARTSRKKPVWSVQTSEKVCTRPISLASRDHPRLHSAVVQWRQLGLDPAGFKRRCRITGRGPFVLAKVSRYISISPCTMPTLSGGRQPPLAAPLLL